jgi:SAM-dependent methyltransferase
MMHVQIMFTLLPLLQITFFPSEIVVVTAYVGNFRTIHKQTNKHDVIDQLDAHDIIMKAVPRRFNLVLFMMRPPIEQSTNATTSSSNSNKNESTMPRRDLLLSSWTIPLGTIGLFTYGNILYKTVSSKSLTTLFASPPIYPIEHEQRVAKMIQTAFTASAGAIGSDMNRIFRVLEVGIGTEARLIRRGLYNDAIHQLSNGPKSMHELNIVGLDVQIPSKQTVLRDMKNMIQAIQDREGIDIDVNLIQASITAPFEQYPNYYFDTVICCLTLCSVNDPTLAVRAMKRLIRPTGGTLGYIEHVAVEDTDHQFLSIEQHVFDPLQQIFVDNCHLHRKTETTIDAVMTEDVKQQHRSIFRERFYVDEMLLASCQACGVIQLVS